MAHDFDAMSEPSGELGCITGETMSVKFKSSAYPWMKNPSSPAIWKVSDVYKMKNNGPRTET